MAANPRARDAAQLAARRASAIFRAVVRGPQPPAPAGWGVEPAKFRGALPWFRWRELVVFANHFAQQGSVANNLAADLAAEVGRRLNPDTANSLGESRIKGKSLAKTASAIALPGNSQEVAAVAYSFSKLTPQLPEYAPVYAAVASGINRGAWKFSRLEAGLIGTALVDVQAHLSDALPAVVRPVLQGLHGTSDNHLEVGVAAAFGSDDQAASAHAKDLTIDELRYLVHACTRLPSPGIKVEEVEVLAAHTQRLIGSANFAKVAHLVVSWLQIRAPAKAKQHYLDVLGAACARLADGRPTHPAHPVLVSGLSPALATLLAREGHRDPPPITPPLVKDIVVALMQMSRGLLSQVDTRPPKGDALNFADWVGIAHLAVEFCDEHGRETNLDTSRSLPGWAAETLGFAVLRAHRPLATKAAPDLESLLTILRLLRRYKANPAPDRSFFVWVAKQLTVHHQMATDSVTLAEIVGELVPQLPPAERGRFAHKLFANAQLSPPPVSTLKASDSAMFQEPPTSAGRLLKDAGSVPSAGVALVAPLATQTGPSRSLRASASQNVMSMRATAGEAQHRLWGRLSPSIASQDAAVQGSQAPEIVQESGVQAESIASHQPEMVAETMGPPSADMLASIQELSRRLEEALNRVASLEAKLEQQSSGLRDDVENLQGRVVAVEVKAEAMPTHLQQSMSEAAVMPQLPAMPQFQLPDFHNLLSDVRQPQSASNGTGGIPARSIQLHLRKPFNFEEFRRSQTQGPQDKRLCVLDSGDVIRIR